MGDIAHHLAEIQRLDGAVARIREEVKALTLRNRRLIAALDTALGLIDVPEHSQDEDWRRRRELVVETFSKETTVATPEPAARTVYGVEKRDGDGQWRRVVEFNNWQDAYDYAQRDNANSRVIEIAPRNLVAQDARS